MKVLLTPNQPLSGEKVEAIEKQLAEFLGIDRESILVLPAGLTVQLVDDYTLTIPAPADQELEP